MSSSNSNLLIKVAAPDQPFQGMIADPGHVVRPGGAPPLVHPHCRKCGVPVERFTIDPIADPHRIAIQAVCHGKTTGTYIPLAEALHKRAWGGVLWLFEE